MAESAMDPALFAAGVGDGDGDGDGFGSGGVDHLSISLGDFMAFLDNHPEGTEHGEEQQPGAAQCCLEMPVTDTMGSENAFQSHREVLENKELWSDQSHVDPQVEMKINEEGAFKHAPAAPHASLSNDLFENVRTGKCDSEYALRDALNCSDVGEEATAPQCEDFSHGFYLGDQPMYLEQMNGTVETYLEGTQSQTDTYSSYGMFTEQSDLSEVKCENTVAMLHFSAQERSHFMPMTVVAFDHNSAVPEVSHPELNIGEAAGSMYNGNSSCLTVQGEYPHGGEYLQGEYGILDMGGEGPLQDLPQDFSQNCLPSEMEQFQQNICGSSSMQVGSSDEYCDDTSLSECYMDVSSPESLSCEQSQPGDVCFRSESSTDSSPVPSSRNSTSEDVGRCLAGTSKQLPNSKVSSISNQYPFKDARDQILPAFDKQYDIYKGGNSSILRNPGRSCFNVDGNVDADLCILEGSSNPAPGPLLPLQGKLHQTFQRSVYANPIFPRFGGVRYKPHDERMTLRLALQDIAQPKSEASPPDGVLAVPLLRHQRIALSWMVQKETSGLHCSGGILADDQGLGKTVSAISLILTERSPAAQSSTMQQDKCEALTVDDDDDDEDYAEPHLNKQPRTCSPEVTSSTVKRENPIVEVKMRPAAGTLVVCPTSVLRQWAEELKSKVTSKANLSFLVYHGSNRTKDPHELTKYDVVLTTYAIVSMEVPKQSNPDSDDEEKGKPDKYGAPVGASGSKKRKSSTSKKTKNGSPTESSLPERPLGRVAWFRVILDEAQSIKNYRTQVARACWGLRAKRRWCLSGTPIQNAVEDLYSYFRFLRYDPYAVYKQFCSMIKVPISKNPTNGYKKLQIVLKTVMLRRTKATTIDGKPIITLPPKTVSLKMVDFTSEERSFYSILEAESREQFKVYAAAGTVKQNYVNILLMLLRLRQACDHPLLVKSYESTSNWRSSLEMVKKLPTERQQELLTCLQTCSAICTLCNDAPEDAVVTICGHVFCNQCILEHLTGDDSICPASNCRVRLSPTSLFSRGTLECSLSGLACDFRPGDSYMEMVHAEKLPGIDKSYASSKVRAALDILLSLPEIDPTHKNDSEKTNGVDTGPSRGPERFEGKSCAIESVHTKVTEKAIVFSQWTRMLDLLEVHLKASHVKYRRLDGTMSVAARERAVKDFNTVPEVSVMIMSLKAASLGLNMVAACHVLLLDLWWNPTTEDQAVDRAHRIGQTRPVTVSRLTVKDTVEDRILALQEKKREMVASAFGEDKSGSRQTRLTVDDLNYLFMV